MTFAYLFALHIVTAGKCTWFLVVSLELVTTGYWPISSRRYTRPRRVAKRPRRNRTSLEGWFETRI